MVKRGEEIIKIGTYPSNVSIQQEPVTCMLQDSFMVMPMDFP